MFALTEFRKQHQSTTFGNKRVKTPFRYPGGKYYSLRYILPFVEKIEHDEYREPFVGGGSVFFAKKKSKKNWINDVHKELVNIYEIIQNDNSYIRFKQLLEKEVATKERYKEIKAFHSKDNIERAYKYYYMNRTSFSGKLISPAWGYREKRSIPPSRWHEVLDPAHDKLRNVQITCQDFEHVVNAKSNFSKVLLYLDPPYFVPPRTKHYVNGFFFQDHIRLADCLRETKYDFLLSYEDCEEIRGLYDWAHVYKLSFPYRVGDSNTTGSRRSIGKEVIISNKTLPEHEQLRLF